ncbi:sigma 54-interacting transcriptional regulator [Sporohalobacter salinus]|uniref:sigma 54-interacting transcriptional regulator n=1 Tax=Sporohalobacter salinus TaxID=1494606 RepID=UPI00195F4F79|nr:sigma 54-interacting transcriptional regulator [Sporohalobacter salinus]MBM7622795.1 arginine utilization regulatory protein [Sporohalobacter salinus]
MTISEPSLLHQPELLKQALLKGFPGGIVIVDDKGNIVAINELVLKLLNIEEDDIVGCKVDNIIMNTRIDEVLETGEQELNRYQFFGNTKILTNRIPIFNQNDEILGVAAYFQEVSEVEECAEKLESVQRLKKNLEAILNSIDDGIHVIDEEGRTIFYNEKMAELENQTREQVINKKLLDVFPSLDRKSSTLMQTLETKEPMISQKQNYINYNGEEITTINKTLPIKLEDQFIGALEIAKDVTDLERLSKRVLDLQSELYETKEDKEELNNGTSYVFSDIIGQSYDLKEKISYAKRAARTSSSVLISGETGTGKELFAQSIHNASIRKNRPFIAQNCAALPKNLLEGILFGTKKGGFTGAVDRKGLFNQADGGTLLLDEINSMSLELQAKLLRVLQEGIIRPVGGSEGVEVDVRIIATINKHPLEAIKHEELRNDLYYRLAVVNLQLPPLRDRKEDILLLVDYFIDHFNRKFNYKIEGISDGVERLFLDYDWPGNVRQLEHVIEGAINIVGAKGIINQQDVEPFMLNAETQQDNELDLQRTEEALPEFLENIEQKLIKDALNETSGNISQAARNLGVKRQSLQYKIKKYGLETK